MSFSSLFVALLLAPVEALVMTSAVKPNIVSRAPLRNIHAEEPPPPPSSGRLGGTVDQDGKSNVWVRASPYAFFRCAPTHGGSSARARP